MALIDLQQLRGDLRDAEAAGGDALPVLAGHDVRPDDGERPCAREQQAEGTACRPRRVGEAVEKVRVILEGGARLQSSGERGDVAGSACDDGHGPVDVRDESLEHRLVAHAPSAGARKKHVLSILRVLRAH